MKNKFEVYLTGFRKNHSTQHALLNTIEASKIKLNMGHKVGVIHMDLSIVVVRRKQKELKPPLKY